MNQDVPKISKFGTPADVWSITETMQRMEQFRALDRALIDNLANGRRPYTDDEVQKHQIQINVNWGEMGKLMQDANRQLNNALLHTGNLFSVACLKGRVEKRDEYGRRFAANLQKPLRRSKSGKKFFYTMKSRNASIVMHGIGVFMWMTPDDWMPRLVPLEDFLVPTDTYIDFSNCTHFAANLYLTAGELFDMTHGPTVQKGWDVKYVEDILDRLLKEQTTLLQTTTFRYQPEKMVELLKQNRAFLDSDAISKAKLRVFFFREPKGTRWFRKIILREGSDYTAESGRRFVYDSDEPFADDLDHIIHCQYGDNSLVSPLKYHSVRGLGTMLYAPVECMNRMRCQFVQHVFQSLLTWFRVQDPVDRDRLKAVMLAQYGVMPEGLSIVPQADRHQIDPRLVESVMSEFRQIMSESSSSFVQDINDGTSKEMTATESRARLQSLNVAVSGMLQNMYVQETFLYDEIKRRFCDTTSKDPQVQEFQDSCREQGIPDELMKDPDVWVIDMERVLGGGDRALAIEESNMLLAQSQRYDPTAQRQILRQYTVAVTNDPAKGNMLVPDAPPSATKGTQAAEDVFGTLMQGIPVSLRQGIDQQGYIEAMLGMLTGKVEQIKNTDNMGTPQEILGFTAVINDINQHLQLFEAVESNRQLAKQYSDHLAQLTNDIKGFAERQQEAAHSQQNQVDPETIAKVQATTLQAQTKAQISQQSAQQKMQLKQQQFEQNQQHKQQQHEQQLTTNAMNAKLDAILEKMKTDADIRNKEAQAEVATVNKGD